MLLAVVCTAARYLLSASCQQVFTSLRSSSPSRNLPHIPVSDSWWGTQPCGYEENGIKVLDQGYCASSSCFSFLWTLSALPRTFGRSCQGSVEAGGKCLLLVLFFVSAATIACSAVILLFVEGKSGVMNKQHQRPSAPTACSCQSSKPPFHEGSINHAAPRHISYL